MCWAGSRKRCLVRECDGAGGRVHQTYCERNYVHDDLFGNVQVCTDAILLLVNVRHLIACLHGEIM